MRWQTRSPEPLAAERWTPDAVARTIAWVLGDGVAPDAHDLPFHRLARQIAGLPADAAARDAALSAVAAALAPPDAWPEARVGLPPRLWEALVARAGGAASPVTRLWVGAREREGFAPDGAGDACGATWWADARHPGATYGERLWAWGTAAGDGLPRCAWRVGDGALAPTPALSALAQGLSDPPLVARGPGHLVACLLDATWTMARGAPLTHRDAAALWGAFFLPVLAPTRAVSDPPDDAGGLPPDYTLQLAFHLLHPRAQAALRILDRLATWSDAGDHDAIRAATGVDGPDALADLLARVARAALARDAASAWDGGLGFRLVRRILRALAAAPEPGAAIDAAFHGGPASEVPLGPLAERLREAFGTALTCADRRAPGAPTSMLVDLALLRWCDPDFLADQNVGVPVRW